YSRPSCLPFLSRGRRCWSGRPPWSAFVQFGSLAMASLVTAVGIGIGALEGNPLTPWLMSRAGEINAVTVFVSPLFWGWLWGAWGLLLALPITTAARVVCERVPTLNPFGELLKR